MLEISDKSNAIQYNIMNVIIGASQDGTVMAGLK